MKDEILSFYCWLTLAVAVGLEVYTVVRLLITRGV